MSYAKLPKLKGSCGIGYQSWNQLRDNLQAIRDDYLVEHSAGNAPDGQLVRFASPGTIYGAPGLYSFGRHNTPAIPRATARIGFSSSLGAAGPPTLDYASSAVVKAVNPISTGLHLVEITGLGTFRATAQPLTSSRTLIYMATVVCVRKASTGAGPVTGVYVYMYQANTNMDLVDGVSYNLTVYGAP